MEFFQSHNSNSAAEPIINALLLFQHNMQGTARISHLEQNPTPPISNDTFLIAATKGTLSTMQIEGL